MPSLSDFTTPAAAANDRYLDMFRGLVSLAPNVSVFIDGAIHRALTSLGRGERTLWYLRLYRVGLAGNMASQDTNCAEIADKIAADYARHAGISEMEAKAQGWHVYNEDSLLDDLESLLRLPIPAVRSFRFGARGPDEIIDDLTAIEKRWRAEAKDAFEDHDAVEVLRFDNGLAWYDLKRETCALEAEAMGHHGNGGREGSGDTILSLRETFDDGRTCQHKPLLSFILDRDGMLGEMKGPFGEKPEQRYHAEIIALLRLPIVRGIKGGGSKPEGNFALSDLDPDTALDLRAEKPELAGLVGVYKTRGLRDPLTLDLLRAALRAQGIEPPMLYLEKDRDVFVIERWRDATAFYRAIGDGLCAALAQSLASGAIGDEITRPLTTDEIGQIIERMDVRAYASLMRLLGLRAIPHGQPAFRRVIALAVQRLTQTDLIGALNDAVRGSLEWGGGVRDALSGQLADYVAAGFPFTSPFQSVKLASDPSQPVSMTIRGADLVGIATAEADGDEDYLIALHEIRQDGWFALDAAALTEKRLDKNLSPAFGPHSGLADDPVIAPLVSALGFDAHRAAAMFTRTSGV